MTDSKQSDSLGGPGEQSFFDGVIAKAGSRAPLYAGGAAAVLLLVIVAVIWASYPSHGGVVDPEAVPLIRADATRYRAKPEDPGGMAIPYRDSTVFNALHGDEDADGNGGKVENLMPKPEQPLPREKLIPGFKAPAVTPHAATLPAAKPAPVKAVPVPAAAPAPIQPVTTPQTVTAPAGGYFIQLGSVRAESDEAASWKKFQALYPSLAGLGLHVAKADLGDKGIYYRLQAGPLDEQKAKDTCAGITAKKPGGCLVIRH